MTQPTPRPAISRRRFLGLTLATGVAAAGGYTLFDLAPWANYDEQAGQTWQPVKDDLPMSEQMKDLVRAATLASNGHNAQPWRFAVHESAIEIHPDYTRRLPVVDPHDRELWMSLGCALENLLLAARAVGYAPEVTYPTDAEHIQVRLHVDTRQPDPRCDAIPRRQNVRSEYNGQPLPSADLDALQSVSLEPGIETRFIMEPGGIETLAEYINAGTLIQYGDKAFIDELIQWLRFNKRQALDQLDGLFTGASGNPQVPGWLGRLFVSRTNPQTQADADARKMRSASGAVVIASQADDRTAWVRAGQVYERLALTLTAREIQSAFLNQPIEVPTLRAQFQTAIGLGEAVPQLLIRFGYGEAMPRALRRPVEQVLM